MIDNNPHLYIFFSADIIDSTKSKYEHDDNTIWFNKFSIFYESFPKEFIEHWNSMCVFKKFKSENKINIWKYVGDEILFYYEITNEKEVPYIINAFKETLEEWNIKNLETDFHPKVKGCSWIGQTPFIDRCFEKGNRIDFVGVSIDCGFRLGKFASEDKLVISVEVADLCSELEFFKIFYLSSEKLKGVFQNKLSYPVFFVRIKTKTTSKEYLLRKECSENDINQFISCYYEKLKEEKFSISIASRINKNIAEYINSKIEESKIITNSNSYIESAVEDVENPNSDNSSKSKILNDLSDY